MMTIQQGKLVVERTGRAIPIATLTPLDNYKAMKAYGQSEAVSAAVAARLITVKVRAG